MLAVLAAIDLLGEEATLVNIVKRSGVDKKTVTALVTSAVHQAGVTISKTGPLYTLEDWGPVLRKKGVSMVLQGALNPPTIKTP